MPAEATPRLSVVVPMYNETRRMKRTLPVLADYFRGQGYRVEFVVVDDGSTDGTSEAIEQQFPSVKIIKGDGDLWFTEGTNTGVRAALSARRRRAGARATPKIPSQKDLKK